MRNDPSASSVLFVGLSAGGHGGIQRFNRRVIASLATLGQGANVAMRADDAPWRFAVRTIRGAMRARVFLIGHVNLLPLAMLFRVLRPGARIILFAHGIEVWGDAAYRPVRWWERVVTHRAIDTVAIVSRFSMQRMVDAFSVSEHKFVLFPNAVDLIEIPDRAAGNTILAVTRLGTGEREKHVDKLILALPALPGARLVVIGDGPLRQELQNLAATIGVGDRVDLLGAVDEGALVRAYAQAHVFALPSTKEGFGIVYLEAWARALPVIGSRFGGSGELISDGVDGFTVDPNDHAALTQAIARLLSDTGLADRLGAAGRLKVEQCYSGAAFTLNLAALL